ncbi:hypothetical protein V6N13_032074 [Hibiscus sabdariffa]
MRKRVGRYNKLKSRRERGISRFLWLGYWYGIAAVIITISNDDVISPLSLGWSLQLLILIWAGWSVSGDSSAYRSLALSSGKRVWCGAISDGRVVLPAFTDGLAEGMGWVAVERFAAAVASGWALKKVAGAGN